MTEICLGNISGSHGVRGWVKVFSFTDPVEAILNYSPWTLRKGQREVAVAVREGQVSGKRLLACLEGVTSRDDADALIGYEVHVSREKLPELAEGEFYWFQLEGLRVKNREGVLFGCIDRMMATGANDVMVVRATPGSIDDRERTIPYVESEVVISVDREAGEVTVNWQTDY